MAQKKFSELEAGAVDGTSIFAQTKTENGSLVSKGATASALAGYIGTSHQFAGLNTDAKDIIGAVNEAAQSSGGASVIQLTQAEYTALSTAEKMNGSIYKLTDKAVMFCLDEEYHALKELTSAQYEALSTAEQNNGTLYIKTDEETTASDIPMSSSESTTVAEAIGEVEEKANTADFTFTPNSGVTASSITACKNDKLCIFSAEIRFTGNANAWTILGNVDVTPEVNHAVTAGVNTSNGSYLGMVAIEQDGRVRIYPTSNVSNGYVMFSLNFKTT